MIGSRFFAIGHLIKTCTSRRGYATVLSTAHAFLSLPSFPKLLSLQLKSSQLSGSRGHHYYCSNNRRIRQFFIVPRAESLHRQTRCLYYCSVNCYQSKLSSKMSCDHPKRICIIGSGNWGSAIAKIVGHNASQHKHLDDRVTMYVYEEIIEGQKLTEIINTTHENVKYLPGHKIPPNVIAVPDVVEAAKDADVLIFVIPHQFIRTICSTLLGKIKPTAIGLSLIKGFDRAEGGGIDLISHIITRHLKIPCSVLMGANLAGEVADEKFCETTIGCKDVKAGSLLRDIIQTSYFRVVVVDDEDTVEVCGALKNIVACGAGFVDGLGLGDNTKAAVIRLGLMEMVKFVDVFYPGGKLSTFFESCGVADLITTCYGGRNRKVSEAFVKTGKSIKELEDEMLNGQKLQGPFTAEEVNYMLKNKDMENKFPLFTAIHKICTGQLPPKVFIDCIREHPEHMNSSLDNIKPERPENALNFYSLKYKL